jgi:hypothetical protein
MLNFSSLALTLLTSSLGVLTLTATAQAYSFRLLDSRILDKTSTEWDFEFVSEGSNEPVRTGDILRVEGFFNLTDARLTAPSNNYNTLDARVAFDALGIFTTNGAPNCFIGDTTACFVVDSHVDVTFPMPVSYQTFSITAFGVPTGFVQAYYNGLELQPTAVPEPTTLLGALVALGGGVWAKRRLAQQA